MRTETLSFSTANGDTTAYVALPDLSGSDTADRQAAVIIIHEWWGLNEHVKDIAKRYAEAGFTAVAPDLYRGKVAATPDEASKMMHALPLEDGIDTIRHAAEKVRETFGSSHLGITGYCMGGTFALRAACDLGKKDGFAAAVAFYGDIPDEAVLSRLDIPTIFISGKRDKWITPEKVAGLEEAAAKNNLPVESIKYDADHAFFNDTRPEVYDAESAKDAWKKAIDFFSEKLK